MFKYTPKPSILRDMEVQKTGRWWDKEVFKRMEILKTYGLPQDYNLTVVLKVNYHNTVYYSPERRKEIPVHGYLFPASMFLEEKV